MPQLVFAFLCLALTVPAAVSASQGQTVSNAPSVLEIPFRLSMGEMLEQVEQLVPEQTGHWRGWKKWNGVDTQYRAWRGRLGSEFRGDTLTLYAHVRYWVRAHKRLLGVDLSGDCGIDEAPRQALIGVQVRFLWNPDWTLRPLFHILPTRFLDRCEMTLANIDVTPVVEQVFRDRMKQSLRQAMEVLGPGMVQIRAHAERAWRGLQEPLALGEQGWLALDPLGMSLAPLDLRQDQARVRLGVLLRPSVHLGQPPAVDIRPLPALIPFHPASDELRFQINLALDYELLNRQLSQALEDRDLAFKDKQFDILSAQVSGKQKELSVKLELDGEAAGSAEIWSNLIFDSATQRLQLEELNFIFEPRDEDIYLAANLFHERIRQALQEVANQWLDTATGQLNQRLQEAMARIAPEGSKLDAKALQFNQVDFMFDADGMTLSGTALGNVGIEFTGR